MDIEKASAEVERLSRELDITNADHIALWLEANLPDASLSYLACRIVEAHEASFAPVVKAMDEYNGILRSTAQVSHREGQNTGWKAFDARVTKILNEHHETWLLHAPSMKALRAREAAGEI